MLRSIGYQDNGGAETWSKNTSFVGCTIVIYSDFMTPEDAFPETP